MSGIYYLLIGGGFALAGKETIMATVFARMMLHVAQVMLDTYDGLIKMTGVTLQICQEKFKLDDKCAEITMYINSMERSVTRVEEHRINICSGALVYFAGFLFDTGCREVEGSIARTEGLRGEICSNPVIYIAGLLFDTGCSESSNAVDI